MNLDDVLLYGHRTVLMAFDGLSEAECNVNGVCGHWSVREIIAHLTSHELVSNDVMKLFLDAGASTPHFTRYVAQGGLAFNDLEVEARSGMSWWEVVREYTAAATEAKELAARVPVEVRRQVGTIPWYGAEYDLEDLFAYSNYGHKREHCAQIAVYRDTLGH